MNPRNSVYRMLGTTRPYLFLDGNDAGAPPSGEGTPDYKALYEAAQATLATERAESAKRLANLQRTFQAEQDLHNQTKSALQTATGELETFKTNFANLETEKGKLSTEIEQLKGTSSKLQFELERKNLVLKDFPELAEFEGKGLLPAVENMEKASEIYKAFSENLAQVAENANRSFRKTTVPEVPTRKDETSVPKSSALLDKAKTLARQGKEQEYNEAMAEYNEALKQEGKA